MHKLVSLLFLAVATVAFADINQDLFDAVSRGNAQATSSALASGADANYATPDGLTVLAVAANDGFFPIVSILLNKNANINQLSDAKCPATPLWFASYTGQDQVVSYLASKGASLQASGGCFGETPLQIASRYNRPSTVALLQSLGAH